MNKKLIILGAVAIPCLGLFSACKDESGTSQVGLPDFKFESKTVVYDGNEVSLEATGIPEGFKVEYTGNKASAKGKYKANCKVYDNKNNLVKDANAILTVDVPADKDFDVFCDDFFLEYLGDDPYSWNVFTIDPSKFGYERPADLEVSWYYYESYTKEDMAEIYKSYVDLDTELDAFDVKSLSYVQEVSYDAIRAFIDSNSYYYNPESNYNNLMEINYVDQFGGYVADLCDTIENYKINSKSDINDILSFLKSSDTAFGTYFTFVKDRFDAGFAYSEYTIDAMVDYLDDISDDGDSYYLYEVVNNKIDSLASLSDSEKASLKTEAKSAIKDDFLAGVAKLSDDLSGAKGVYTITTEGYFANYGEPAKTLYKKELESRLGYSDINMDEYIKRLDDWMKEYSMEMDKTLNTYYSWQGNQSYQKNAEDFLKFVNGQKKLTEMKDPAIMIQYLKEFAKTIVPDLKTDPEISFKYMDDSVARISSALAYYLKSPLDSTSSESITLNKYLLGSNRDEMLTTIAHEGYPGHLYEYVYTKELGLSNVGTIMTNTGHGEGWAKYVETCLYDYIGSKSKSSVIQLYCDYSKYDQIVSYLLYTRVDVGINYQGWSIEEVGAYLKRNGFNEGAAQDLFRTLIEMPTQYASYGYGLALVYDLHQDAKEKLGDLYDEVSYNANFMSHGWCNLEVLERICQEYVDDVMYVNNKVAE